MALAALSEHLGSQGRTNWFENPLGSEASIVYPMPGETLVHRLGMGPEAKEEFFAVHVAAKLPRARQYASFRRLGQAVKASLSPSATTNGGANHSLPKSGQQPRLAPELELADAAIAQIVEAARHYADPEKILEVVGRTPAGELKLVLHANHLLEAMEQRRIQVGHAALPDHITISCLLPNHRDSTPSLRVYFRQGTFHCFGCQAHG